MPQKWIEPEEINPPADLVETIGGHPLVAATLAKRGIEEVEEAKAFLDPLYYTPAPASDLPGLSQAADRIETAIKQGRTILVWGDFDVDGQTATTTLVQALHDLGGKVVFHIPIRETEGHGIKPQVLDSLITSNSPAPNVYPTDSEIEPEPPSLLLTCDTGIAEYEAVLLAQSLGLEVIITDHHEPKATLPEADAVVNPHLLTEGHPLSTLPGVGVAYKLVEELFMRRGNLEDAAKYLDLVALGIVADVAELVGDTRYLLQLGLRVLRNTKRPGLQALYRIADLIPDRLDEGHIGFSIGPRLNALGRLSDANPIVAFFTTEDPGRAETLAQRLEMLNQRRRLLTNEVYAGALAQIERDAGLLDYSALVMGHPGWPNGIIGIVASRLVEKFGVPTVLLNLHEDGSASGSARSIEGVHLSEAIAAQADLLTGFGGHAGAAGLSLPVENIPVFRSRLSRTIRQMTAGAELAPRLQIDAYLPLAELTLDLVDDLERLGPFGAGNPPLILASKEVKLVSQREIGRAEEHLRLVVEDASGHDQEILWWQGAGENLPEEGAWFELAYKVGSNTFRGERRLQLEWVDFRLPESLPEDKGGRKPSLEIIDYRTEPHPLKLLIAIRDRGEVQVWAEGEAQKVLDACNRDALLPHQSLAIWTAPPDHQVLQEAIIKADPEMVFLFGVAPDLDSVNPFLKRLAGLVKTVINQRQGRVQVGELAAAMAHSQRTILVGLGWLEAKGVIEMEANGEQEESRLVLSHGDGEEKDHLVRTDQELKILLAEAAAYRRYFQKADKDQLLGGMFDR